MYPIVMTGEYLSNYKQNYIMNGIHKVADNCTQIKPLNI